MQKIYKREEWAAKAPCEPIDKMASPQNISIIYHTATPWECVNFVRFHAKILLQHKLLFFITDSLRKNPPKYSVH